MRQFVNTIQKLIRVAGLLASWVLTIALTPNFADQYEPEGLLLVIPATLTFLPIRRRLKPNLLVVVGYVIRDVVWVFILACLWVNVLHHWPDIEASYGPVGLLLVVQGVALVTFLPVKPVRDFVWWLCQVVSIVGPLLSIWVWLWPLTVETDAEWIAWAVTGLWLLLALVARSAKKQSAAAAESARADEDEE